MPLTAACGSVANITVPDFESEIRPLESQPCPPSQNVIDCSAEKAGVYPHLLDFFVGQTYRDVPDFFSISLKERLRWQPLEEVPVIRFCRGDFLIPRKTGMKFSKKMQMYVVQCNLQPGD